MCIQVCFGSTCHLLGKQGACDSDQRATVRDRRQQQADNSMICSEQNRTRNSSCTLLGHTRERVWNLNEYKLLIIRLDRKLHDDRRFVKVSAMCCICTSWQKRTVLSTHHCSYLRSSVVVDAGQHERRQEEEEGAGGRVDQVLQGDTDRITLETRWSSVLLHDLCCGIYTQVFLRKKQQ